MPRIGLTVTAGLPQQLDRHRLSVAVQIQSIERAAAVLRLLTGHSRPQAAAELAAELQPPKGSVYGILRTLQGVGFVEQDTESGKYQLAAAVLPIGSSYLNGNELRQRGLGRAQALAVDTAETVRIGTWHDDQVLIVHHILGPDESLQAAEAVSLRPLHATALGKAPLADHPHPAAAAHRQGLASCTPATITDPERMRLELEQIASRGWASDVGEFMPWIASIAAPIRARSGTAVGAIAISGQTARICPAGSPQPALVGCVTETAGRISHDLGGRRW